MRQLIIDHFPLLVVVLVLLAALLLGRLLLPDRHLPYEKRPSLVTDAELQFYAALADVVDQRWRIFTMVRLADVIRVRATAVQRMTWQNRILAKHVDFVLCDRESLEAILAIELDDSSHQRADRAARDQFLEAALQASKLPLLRVPVASDYDRGDLRKSVEALIEGAVGTKGQKGPKGGKRHKGRKTEKCP